MHTRFNFLRFSIVNCLAFLFKDKASNTNFSSFNAASAAAVDATLILPLAQDFNSLSCSIVLLFAIA